MTTNENEYAYRHLWCAAALALNLGLWAAIIAIAEWAFGP